MSMTSTRPALVVAGSLAALIVASSIARAETYRPAHTFTNPAPAFTIYGGATALAGGEAFVGAPADSSGAQVGQVHVYDVASGALLRTLTDPTAGVGDGFGTAIVALGSNVLIGAPGAPGGGAAYLLDRATGSVVHTFANPTPGTGQFGAYVGTLGGDILIGTRYFVGGAEVFDGTTYAHLRTLAGNFRILATRGNDLVVSPSAGTAEVRDGTTGAVIQTFTDPLPGGNFGAAGGAVGSTVIIGDPEEDGVETAEGAVYAYSANGALIFTLHPEETYETFGFGAGITVAGNSLFITAARGGEDGRGEVQLFDGTTGTRLHELYPPHPPRLGPLSTANSFGAAVAADGERVLIGTPGDARRPPYFGAAHLYDRCGNAIRVSGEECDDGNTADGDGCSSTCRLEVCGSAPRFGCVGAGRATLSLFDPYVVYNTRAKLKWSFSSSSGGPPDFGDPTSTASYVFCVYAGQPPVVQVAALAGGTCNGAPCWTPRGTGYRYRGDDEALPDGDLDLRLGSHDSTTKLKLVGIGENLGIPDRSCPECPIPYTGTVTAQLVNSDSGACWSSTFGVYRNRAGKLTAKQ